MDKEVYNQPTYNAELEPMLKNLIEFGSRMNGRLVLFDAHLVFECVENIGMVPVTSMPFPKKEQILAEVYAILQANYTLQFQQQFATPTRYDDSAISQQTAVKLIELLCEQGLATPEQASVAFSTYDGAADGVLGPNETCMLREWPRVSQNIHRLLATRTADDVPSNTKELLLKSYHAMMESGEGINPETNEPMMTADEWCVMHYYSSIDQFNELLLNLRDRKPGRHLMSTYHPEYAHEPKYAPDVNAMLARSGKNNDPVLIQCFLDTACAFNNQPTLMMKLTMSELNIQDINYVLGVYGVLLQLIAQATDCHPTDLIVDVGEYYLPLFDTDSDDEIDHAAEALLDKIEFSVDPSATLILPEDKKDLYQLSFDDLSQAFTYPMEASHGTEEN